MVNLLSKYKNHTTEHEKFYLLGHKTPHTLRELDNEEMVNLFLYSYSFLGLNALDFISLNKLKQTLVNELNTLKKKGEKIKNYHRWWALTLAYFKIGANAHNLYFIENICETLIDKVQTFTERELVSYCNILNDSLSEIIGYDLRIRPSLDKNPNVYIYQIYRDLTLHSKDIINILKQNLNVAEVNNDDINREFALIDNIGYTYDKWSVIFDILTGQILAQIDKSSFSSNPTEHLINTIDLCLLNLYVDTDIIPKNLTSVRTDIINILHREM